MKKRYFNTSSLDLLHLKNTAKIPSVQIKILDIHKTPLKRKTYANQLFPQTKGSSPFKIVNNLNTLDFEITWTLNLISLYKSQLRGFLDLKQEYTIAFFKSEFERCLEILDICENKYGLNFWLIESRINLANILEENGAYFELLMNSKISFHYKLISWIISLKSEDFVSNSRFNIELERLINRRPAVSYFKLKDFLTLHFSSFKYNSPDLDYHNIFTVLENFSLIDRYFTLVKYFENIIENPDKQHISKEIFNKIKLIIQDINPSQVSPYYKILMNDSEINPPLASKLALQALDEYTYGNYSKAKELCERVIQIHPHEIEIYEIYVKSLINLEVYKLDNPKNIFYLKLLNYFIDMATTNDKQLSESITDELLKLSLVHSNNSWSWKLMSAAITYKYGNNILKKISYFKTGYKLSNYMKPQIVSNMFDSDIHKKQYIELIFDPESTTREVHNYYSSLNIEGLANLSIDENRKLRLIGNLHLIKQDYKNALKVFNCIDSKTSTIYGSEITIGKVIAYKSLENYEIAMNLMVESYFKGNELFLDIDCTDVLEKIDDIEYDFSNINILIFINLVAEYTNGATEVRKHNHLEDFLIANSITYVSELDISLYDKKKIIYFLKEYCTIDSMSKYYMFSSQEQVEEERIKICSLLMQIDPDNEKIYNQEIKEITEKMQIRFYTATFEKSKIYVDIEGIKKQAASKIEDNFNRIQEYFISNRKKGTLITYEIDPNNELDTSSFKNNSYSEIYNDLIFQFRDTFLFSKEYGLDVYLSLGIRHGTINSHFRKLFEKDHFLTLFNSSTNQYKSNDFWLEKLNAPTSKINRDLNLTFETLSYNIDSLLFNLQNEKLQISTDYNNRTSLLNYYIDKYQMISQLFFKDSQDTYLTLDKFIDSNIEFLWLYTEVNLEKVRKYLINNFKQDLLLEIKRFEKNIMEINSKNNNILNLEELNQKLTDLKTDIEYQITNVSNWFKKEKVIDVDNFSLELPVNISLEYIKSSNLNSKIIYNKNINDTPLIIDGKYLKWFNELFTTIFDNVIKRSGFRESFEINIFIQSLEEDIIFIRCTNPLKLNSREIYDRKAKLAESLKEIHYLAENEESDLISRASKEGGSGLYKIVKLLKYDIKSEAPRLDFGIDEDETFYIDITLNTRGIKCENSVS